MMNCGCVSGGFMWVKRFLAGVVVASFAVPGLAGVITLDFEGVGDSAQILNFYNGGTDSMGNLGPNNYGVFFTKSAVAVKTGDQSNKPSPPTVMLLNGTFAYFDIASGFGTAFSTYYSTTQALSLTFWSGLDGSGSEIFANSIDNVSQGGVTHALSSNTNKNCVGATWCAWDAVSYQFSNNAVIRSVAFGGGNGKTAFDTMTFGCATPGGCASSNTPEPGSLALVGLALAGLGWTSRRARV
jgi:hypothetical protein